MQILKTVATMAVIGLAGFAQAEDAKSILFYGNSFTQSGGGVHRIVRGIALAAGHPMPHVFSRAVGGQTLQYHLDTGISVITSGIQPGRQWDAVVLQEFSTRPTSHPSSGNVPAFYSAAAGLYQAVLDHSPEAQAVLFQTWARAPGNSVYPNIWPDPAAMQAEVSMYYDEANETVLSPMGFSEVARVGDAFQAGGFDTSLYGGDLYHASNRGALLIGLVLYGTIYDDATLSDIDLSDITSGLGLTAADAQFVVGLAEAVLIPAPASGSVLFGLGIFAARRVRRIR